MTRGELVTRVAQKLSFETTAASEELLLLQALANEGVVEVLINTRCNVDVGELTLVAATNNYRLDSTVLAILERTITTSYAPLNIVSAADMYDMRRGQNVSSPARYLASEGNLLMVYPTPTQTEIITFLYVAKPTLMTADGNDPALITYGGIPIEYHRAIEYYMLWQGAEYDDKAAPQKPVEYMEMFEKECGKIRKRHRAKGGRGFTPARVGYPGSINYPKRNDVY